MVTNNRTRKEWKQNEMKIMRIMRIWWLKLAESKRKETGNLKSAVMPSKRKPYSAPHLWV
jgi:hypothetical protein